MRKNISLLLISFLFSLLTLFASSIFIPPVSATHAVPNCDYKRTGGTNGPPFCPNASSSSDCLGFGSSTGNQCCALLGYDSCSDRQIFPGGPPSPWFYELYCCTNPTPTPTLPPPTPTPTPTLPPPTPTPTPTIGPTPVPCQVTTSPAVHNLSCGGTGTVTASVTSGLGLATVTQMRFGSYNTSIATVSPTSDPTSPYTTTVTGVASGATAVWGTADLSDGRICQSSGATDTDVNVSCLTPTPTPPPPTPVGCQACGTCPLAGFEWLRDCSPPFGACDSGGCTPPPPTPTPAPPTPTPTPTPIPLCAAGFRQKIVTAGFVPIPGCVGAGANCSVSPCCPGLTCTPDVYGSTCTGTPASSSLAVTETGFGQANCPGQFLPPATYTAVSQSNNIPVGSTRTRTGAPCMQWQDITRGAVFNFAGFYIPQGITIRSATLFSPSSGTCQAGVLSGRVGNVGAGPFSSSGFSPSGRFGSNALIRSSSFFDGCLFPGLRRYCGGCYDPVYDCGSSGLPSGTGYPTSFIQGIVNTQNLTEVAFWVRPDGPFHNLCFAPSDASQGETGSFTVNNPPPPSLTIDYCEPLYSISGNVFVDEDRSTLKDGAEVNYSLGTSTIEFHTGNDPLCSPATLGIPPEIPAACAGAGSNCNPPTCCPGLSCTFFPGDLYNPPRNACTGVAFVPPPTPNPIMTTTTGAYTTRIVLPAGQYTMCYTSLPASYDMTFPVTGIGFPNFNVTVGPNCSNCPSSSCTSNSATCGIVLPPTPTPVPGCSPTGSVGPVGASCAGITCCNGLSCVPGDIYSAPQCPAPPAPPPARDILNANFGIVRQIDPWFQSRGLDLRVDSGFVDVIPGTALPSPFASLDGAGGTPGIIFSGSSNPDFGTFGGNASSTDWIVGNFLFPEIYTPPALNVIKTSYSYLLAVAEKSDITPTDIAPSCGGSILSCTLSLPLDPGLFIANGDLNIVNPSFTVPSNQDYVILVSGNLTLRGNILVPIGSTVTFSVSGNIIVDQSVGTSASSTSPSLEGFYSTDGSFIVNGNNDCAIGADRRLNIGGSVVTNAALAGGSLQNQRNLCADNADFPSLFITERPDFILNAPQFIQSTQTIWQEVAP